MSDADKGTEKLIAEGALSANVSRLTDGRRVIILRGARNNLVWEIKSASSAFGWSEAFWKWHSRCEENEKEENGNDH